MGKKRNSKNSRGRGRDSTTRLHASRDTLITIAILLLCWPGQMPLQCSNPAIQAIDSFADQNRPVDQFVKHQNLAVLAAKPHRILSRRTQDDKGPVVDLGDLGAGPSHDDHEAAEVVILLPVMRPSATQGEWTVVLESEAVLLSLGALRLVEAVDDDEAAAGL